MEPQDPQLNIENEENSLVAAGFTPMGINRFKRTIQAYATSLFKIAYSYAEMEREDDLAREITHDHVRSAALKIATQPSNIKTKWYFVQASEYISTASAGAGAGHLDKAWGIILFVAGTAIAVLLFVLRKIYTN